MFGRIGVPKPGDFVETANRSDMGPQVTGDGLVYDFERGLELQQDGVRFKALSSERTFRPTRPTTLRKYAP